MKAVFEILDRIKRVPWISSPETGRLIRFVLVGVLNTIIGYGTFFILSYYLNYLVALLISHFIGVSNSYIWNKYWTFGTQHNHLREFLKFNSVYLVALLVNLTTLSLVVNVLKVDPRIGQLILLPIVTMISYFGHRYWSFRSWKNFK
jgi:putative flippase GtrA